MAAKTVGLAVLATAFAGCVQKAEAAKPRWQFSTGVDYSTGQYGTGSDITVTDVPIGAQVQFERLRVDVTIPFVQMDGPSGVVSGVPVVGPNGTQAFHRCFDCRDNAHSVCCYGAGADPADASRPGSRSAAGWPAAGCQTSPARPAAGHDCSYRRSSAASWRCRAAADRPSAQAAGWCCSAAANWRPTQAAGWRSTQAAGWRRSAGRRSSGQAACEARHITGKSRQALPDQSYGVMSRQRACMHAGGWRRLALFGLVRSG